MAPLKYYVISSISFTERINKNDTLNIFTIIILYIGSPVRDHANLPAPFLCIGPFIVILRFVSKEPMKSA
jgi:hypothetical protein